jgi:hypothetical protein
VVHIDPGTGRPTATPLPEQSAALEALQRASANRSTEGLVEEPGPTGGFRVNLRNRFRNPLVATADSEGNLQLTHVTCNPAEGDS